MNLTPKIVPYSSVLGSSVSLHDEAGAVVAIIMVTVPRPSLDYKEVATPIIEKIAQAFAPGVGEAVAWRMWDGQSWNYFDNDPHHPHRYTQPLYATPDQHHAAVKTHTLIIGWQPIETAPWTLDVVLLYQPSGPGTAEAVGQGHRTSLNEHAHDKWVFQATGYIAEPTHWRPMPAPPNGATPLFATPSNAAVVEAANALIAKLDKVRDDSRGVFVLAAMHGQPYRGVTWADEVVALRTALAAIKKEGGE